MQCLRTLYHLGTRSYSLLKHALHKVRGLTVSTGQDLGAYY
jgi:hypothetical protein